MKKVIKLLPILLVVALTLFLTGCNQDINAPGKVWAQTETLIYAVTEGETAVGTMTIVTERVSGEQTLGAYPDRKHDLSIDGTRVTTTVRNVDGDIIQYSESLMRGFAAVASYRSVNYGGEQSSYHVYIDGSYAYLSLNDGDYERTRMRGTYTTNELLYTLLRCYDLSAYSTSYTILSPITGDKIGISVSSGASSDTFSFTAQNPDGEKQEADKESYGVLVRLSDSPVGSSIRLWYSKDYSLKGDALHGNTSSSRLLLKIEENNLTYTLTKVIAA